FSPNGESQSFPLLPRPLVCCYASKIKPPPSNLLASSAAASYVDLRDHATCNGTACASLRKRQDNCEALNESTRLDSTYSPSARRTSGIPPAHISLSRSSKTHSSCSSSFAALLTMRLPWLSICKSALSTLASLASSGKYCEMLFLSN